MQAEAESQAVGAGTGQGLIPEEWLEWMLAHPAQLEGLLIFSLVTFVGSLVVLPFLVAAIPVDYFEQCKPPRTRISANHPVLRGLLLGIKNLGGALLVLMGIVMLVIPGQGVLTILIGLSLLSFPGKRALEIAIVRRPSVLRALNWVRAKSGKEPLRVLQKAPHSSGSLPGR